MPFTGLSDHCCISLKIKTNGVPKEPKLIQNDISGKEDRAESKIEVKLRYDSKRKHIFEENLMKNCGALELDTLLAKIDLNVSEVNEGGNNKTERHFDILCKKIIPPCKIQKERETQTTEHAKVVYKGMHGQAKAFEKI